MAHMASPTFLTKHRLSQFAFPLSALLLALNSALLVLTFDTALSAEGWVKKLRRLYIDFFFQRGSIALDDYYGIKLTFMVLLLVLGLSLFLALVLLFRSPKSRALVMSVSGLTGLCGFVTYWLVFGRDFSDLSAPLQSVWLGLEAIGVAVCAVLLQLKRFGRSVGLLLVGGHFALWSFVTLNKLDPLFLALGLMGSLLWVSRPAAEPLR
jgi:hypothetical protein